VAHKKRTPEEACIAYAEAVEAVRKQTRFLRDRANYCENYEPTERAEYNIEAMALVYPGYAGTSKSSCLDEFFSAPKGPDGEFPRYQEFHGRMCDACKNRLDAINLRSNARKVLGACKRSVEAIGKRSKAVA
jgi:hypothetical protein